MGILESQYELTFHSTMLYAVASSVVVFACLYIGTKICRYFIDQLRA